MTDWLTPGEIVFAVVFFVPFVTVMAAGCLYIGLLLMEHVIEDL
jgi:hypothetical protein